MTQIYSRQAQSFLVPDTGLYKRTPPHQMIPYMVRMSGTIRSTPMHHRSAAIKLVQANMHEAWAKIHRHLRPYFFQQIDDVLERYPGSSIELPDLADKPNIHEAMHFCFDTLIDLDRLTVLLQSDPSIEDSSDVVFACWNAVCRATSRVEGLENRIKSGKAFNGGV
jgi:hypothetical protein